MSDLILDIQFSKLRLITTELTLSQRKIKENTKKICLKNHLKVIEFRINFLPSFLLTSNKHSKRLSDQIHTVKHNSKKSNSKNEKSKSIENSNMKFKHLRYDYFPSIKSTKHQENHELAKNTKDYYTHGSFYAGILPKFLLCNSVSSRKDEHHRPGDLFKNIGTCNSEINEKLAFKDLKTFANQHPSHIVKMRSILKQKFGEDFNNISKLKNFTQDINRAEIDESGIDIKYSISPKINIELHSSCK